MAKRLPSKQEITSSSLVGTYFLIWSLQLTFGVSSSFIFLYYLNKWYKNWIVWINRFFFAWRALTRHWLSLLVINNLSIACHYYGTRLLTYVLSNSHFSLHFSVCIGSQNSDHVPRIAYSSLGVVSTKKTMCVFFIDHRIIKHFVHKTSVRLPRFQWHLLGKRR